jgi:hypothetical protein
MIKSSQDTIKLSIYRNSNKKINTSTSISSFNVNNNSNNGVISIGCNINQGDHASMGVINSTENDFLLMSKSQDNSLQNKFSLLAKNTLESFKSEDFVYCAGGDGILTNKTPSRIKHLNHLSTNNKITQSNDLPSPIPFLPPIKPKSTLTDSDYKTQTSSVTDLYSSISEQVPTNKQALIAQFNNLDTDDDCNSQQQETNDDERMDACEKLLNLEEEFIEQMQKGLQQYKVSIMF